MCYRELLNTDMQNPRSDFEQRVQDAGWNDRVLYLERGDAFDFGVRK